jgi:hypothetical protein
MSPNLSIVILVVLLVVGWFALGTHFNVRKGHAWLRWLQDGLPLAGAKTTLRWLGSSVVELKIQKAEPPFRSAEIFLVLEPRDVGPLWALARLRGRRDLFIFRATLSSQPHLQLEVFDPRAWSARGIARRCEEQRWESIPVSAPLVAYGPGQPAAAAQVLQAAELPGSPLVRLSVRRTEPHLEIQWDLAHLRKLSSRTVFETLRHVTESL